MSQGFDLQFIAWGLVALEQTYSIIFYSIKLHLFAQMIAQSVLKKK